MRASDSDINPYLQQEVLTASPIRLRQMLINRAEELCPVVQQLWADGKRAEAASWLLRIREILGELLSGIRDAANPLSERISDFYIFLLQLVTEIEQNQDLARLTTLKDLLAIEKETWRQVQQQVATEGASAPSSYDGPTPFGNSPPSQPAAPAPQKAISPIYAPSSFDTPSSGSFSLEV